MSSNPEEDTKNVASSSDINEIKTETGNKELIKKETAEELKNESESYFKELLAKAEQKRECEEIKGEESLTVDVKKEKLSSDSETEGLLIVYEPKSSPETADGCSKDNSNVKEVLNTEGDLVAKSRLIRHDSIEIKEEYISDEDVNNPTNKLKRPHQEGPEAETSSEGTETKKKRVWNRNVGKRRQGEGEYNRLCAELSENEESYYKYFRMSHKAFDELHEILKPNITKMSSNYRTPISSRERLVVCLRYLVSGESYGAMATTFNLGRSTVSDIVRETCKEIWRLLRPLYMPIPNRKIWEESERGFSDIFNFPNCVGCIDGKHVTISFPRQKKHDNYDKKNSRIVLLTVIDPWCKFTVIDIGDYGYPNDLGIFEETDFYHTYIESIRRFVPSKTLPGTTSIAPRVFIGDETFTLQPFLLRPFPVAATKVDESKRKFNERLKEPRNVVKDTFDMLVKNWKIFSRPFETDLDTALEVVRATCCLHNYVIKQGVVDEEGEESSEESQPKRSGKRKKPKKTFIGHKPSNRRWTTEAGRVREMFVSYFNK